MAEEEGQLEEAEIKETDIVFDCPFCGKSLAIDYRGAGLTIPCTDCGKLVEVPIPEGMELEDFDRSQEEQEVSIMHLRKALTTAEAQIDHLQKEVTELRERRKSLEEFRTNGLYRFSTILERMEVVEKAAGEITAAVSGIVEMARDAAQGE